MPLERPGVGLPLETYFFTTEQGKKAKLRRGVFPSAVCEWTSNTPTVRETGMLWFMNHVTDKPNWWEKVYDEEILQKWKKELAEMAKVQGWEEVEVADVDEPESDDEGEGKGEGEDAPETAQDKSDDNDEKRSKEDDDEDEAGSGNDNEEGSNAGDDDNNDEDDNDDNDDNDDDNDADSNEDMYAAMGLGDAELGNSDDDDDDDADDADDAASDEYPTFSTEMKPPVGPLSQGFSDKMFDFCIQELREKAELNKRTGIVSVLDGAAAVFKSDTAVSTEVRDALRKAVKPLEEVPADQKDWHPGSDEQVLDLVHPSLWPLVYGKTRILADRELTRENCMAAYGSGDTIPVPPPLPKGKRWDSDRQLKRLFSTKFQWLPCEVDVTGAARIKTYINSLPYSKNMDLYSTVEKVIDAALPLWSAAYDRTMTWNAVLEDANTAPEYGSNNLRLFRSRLQVLGVDRKCTTRKLCKASEEECSPENRPGRPTDDEVEAMEDDYEGDGDIYEDVEKADDEWLEKTHPIVQPEPEDYSFFGYKDYKSQGPWFAPHTNTSRIQVIVKLANIELTPEKPTYPGGSWHIEGQLNERICATALYYYDVDNVTESHLAFRTNCDAENMSISFNYEQSKHAAFCQVYGVADAESSGHATMHMGQVNTRQDRLLVFPNVFQHQVQPFELADKTKTGHRKILALFLVDPLTPIISTANVPPQQKHWGTLGDVDGKLPPELSKMVYDDLKCPYDLHEAKKLREQLMEERKALEVKTNKVVEGHAFSLCEH